MLGNRLSSCHPRRGIEQELDLPVILEGAEAMDATGSLQSVVAAPQKRRRTANPAGKRTRVLQVNYHHSFGGSEQLAATIGAKLDPERFESLFAAMKGDGDVGQMLRERGYATNAFGRHDGFDLSAYWRVWKYLSQAQIDIVQTHHVGSLVYCGPPARLSRRKVLHTEHDIHSFERWPHELRWLRWLSKLPHRFVAIDPTIADFLHSEAGIPRDKIQVIRNGIDLAKFHPPKARAIISPDRPFVVGWIARMSSPKRPDVLIDALAIAAREDPTIHGRFIGSGDLLPGIQHRAQAAGIADRVEFLGARHDVPELLREVDCFALCSDHEGLPISLIEAMATELPCIVSAVGGIPKLITDEVHGLLLPDSSPSELAARILRLRNHPSEGRRIGQSAGSLARGAFDLTNTIEQYHEVLESLIARPSWRGRAKQILRPVKPAVFAGLTGFRADRWARSRSVDNLLVVGYHGVIRDGQCDCQSWLNLPERAFEKQIAYLKEHYKVVPFSWAARRLVDGVAFDVPTACITFDDGYKNNATIAAPLLTRYELPATIYLATGFIGSQEILWMPRLEQAMCKSSRREVVLTDLGLATLPLGAKWMASFVQLVAALYRMPSARRRETLAVVLQRLAADARLDLSSFEMMSWHDVVELESTGLFEFGGHTVSHQILTPLSDEEVEREIGESIQEVARHIRGPQTTFAYPNGRADDFGERAKEAVRRNGLLAAVSTIAGLNTSKSDRFALRRIVVGSQMGINEFRLRVSGVVT